MSLVVVVGLCLYATPSISAQPKEKKEDKKPAVFSEKDYDATTRWLSDNLNNLQKIQRGMNEVALQAAIEELNKETTGLKGKKVEWRTPVEAVFLGRGEQSDKASIRMSYPAFRTSGGLDFRDSRELTSDRPIEISWYGRGIMVSAKEPWLPKIKKGDLVTVKGTVHDVKFETPHIAIRVYISDITVSP
jgi:hypothetical protein